jgi:hypothetical protein
MGANEEAMEALPHPKSDAEPNEDMILRWMRRSVVSQNQLKKHRRDSVAPAVANLTFKGL